LVLLELAYWTLVRLGPFIAAVLFAVFARVEICRPSFAWVIMPLVVETKRETFIIRIPSVSVLTEAEPMHL
jgi:hypothetical protein